MTTKEKFDFVTDLIGWSKIIDDISNMMTREELESFYDWSIAGDIWRESKVERLEELIDEFIIIDEMQAYFDEKTMDKFLDNIIKKNELEGYFSGELLFFKSQPRIGRGQIHIELK